MLRSKSMHGTRKKEMRDSQNHGGTVAYKENIVYNICMKPRGTKTDAMPLSFSEVPSWVRTCKTGKTQIQKTQEEQEEQEE